MRGEGGEGMVEEGETVKVLGGTKVVLLGPLAEAIRTDHILQVEIKKKTSDYNRKFFQVFPIWAQAILGKIDLVVVGGVDPRADHVRYTEGLSVGDLERKLGQLNDRFSRGEAFRALTKTLRNLKAQLMTRKEGM
jgi:hypothetical protein